MSTWLELAKNTSARRARFTVDWDIFPETIVPVNTTCVVLENGLDKSWSAIRLRPDDGKVRSALAKWDGEIELQAPNDFGEQAPITFVADDDAEDTDTGIKDKDAAAMCEAFRSIYQAAMKINAVLARRDDLNTSVAEDWLLHLSADKFAYECLAMAYHYEALAIGA
jgi:hypothetical protein